MITLVARFCDDVIEGKCQEYFVAAILASAGKRAELAQNFDKTAG